MHPFKKHPKNIGKESKAGWQFLLQISFTIISQKGLKIFENYNFKVNPLMHNVPKWSNTFAARFLKCDHFGTLCIKWLNVKGINGININ